MDVSQAGDGAHIGKSVVIKGELSGSEDLYVDGNVEGKIELRDHRLTVGPNGNVKAERHRQGGCNSGQVGGEPECLRARGIVKVGSGDGGCDHATHRY